MYAVCVNLTGVCFSDRLNDRVKKRAMTSFEKDRTLSNLSTQLDYKVQIMYCHIAACMREAMALLMVDLLLCLSNLQKQKRETGMMVEHISDQ